jgi:predicted Zn finger-like uncharacterized protein
MIAGCPTCGARYRIEVSKLRPEGAKLRCTRCEAVFRVRPPNEAGAARPAPEPELLEPRMEAAPPRRAPEPVPAPAPAPVAAPAAAPASGEASRLVLIAHPEVSAGKAAAAALASWGFEALVVQDGVEAMLAVARSLPRAVVLDAALPKMFGFQVCEVIKRNESLRHIHVVLVGAIHDQSRYRRPPNEIYGADAYVERQELPDALASILEGLGMPVQGGTRPAPRKPDLSRGAASPVRMPPAAAAPAPAPAPAAPAARPAPAAAPAPVRARSGDGLDDARAQAERLARIIVSDIVLYNAAKFEAGVRSGDVVGALDGELEEGRALFAARIDPRVGSADEFLQRELLRVARSRGMAG